MTGLCYHAHNENSPFYMDRICIIYSSHAYDITLVAQVLSHYVHHLVTNRGHKTNFTNIYSLRKGKMLVCLGSE
jgi:hypothetical protein